MSKRSSYLRDEAAACEAHARVVADAQTRDELRKLAAKYIERAAAMESRPRQKNDPSSGEN
jgi:hypothetical protein